MSSLKESLSEGLDFCITLNVWHFVRWRFFITPYPRYFRRLMTLANQFPRLGLIVDHDTQTNFLIYSVEGKQTNKIVNTQNKTIRILDDVESCVGILETQSHYHDSSFAVSVSSEPPQCKTKWLVSMLLSPQTPMIQNWMSYREYDS